MSRRASNAAAGPSASALAGASSVASSGGSGVPAYLAAAASQQDPAMAAPSPGSGLLILACLPRRLQGITERAQPPAHAASLLLDDLGRSAHTLHISPLTAG